jgi:hypothetical protein
LDERPTIQELPEEPTTVVNPTDEADGLNDTGREEAPAIGEGSPGGA